MVMKRAPSVEIVELRRSLVVDREAQCVVVCYLMGSKGYCHHTTICLLETLEFLEVVQVLGYLMG